MTDKRSRNPLIPTYAVFPLISCLLVNSLVYFGISRLADSWKHYDLTLPFDRAVPLVPEFVSIYVGCYLFWAANYILIARQGKENCIRFATADMLSRVICCVFFLLLPTTNIRPMLTGNDIWTKLLQYVYATDAPTNLFPSIHCLVSWFCYIGIRGKKTVPVGYRIFSCVFAVLVFVSTQVTKQHYIVDVFGAVIIAESTYYIAFHTNCWKIPELLFDKLHRAVFERGAVRGKES